MYWYYTLCIKKKLDETATGDGYISIPSRPGGCNISVSMGKQVKNSKNNKDPYRNVAEKKK